MAAGAEADIYTPSQIIAMEHKNARRLGAIADTPIYSIPYTQVKNSGIKGSHLGIVKQNGTD